MRFLLMINANPGERDWSIYSWPAKDREVHSAYWQRLNGELRQSGELVMVQVLAPPKEAKLVRSSKADLPVTDGVFPESKEFLAGFWMVEVPSAARAEEIAATASRVPGIGGEPMFLPIEVRQVMASP